MALLITQPGGALLGPLNFVVERGVDPAHVAIAITNPGVVEVAGGIVSMYAEQTSGMGDFLTSGHPSVDERWGRFQITGVDSSGTAGQDSGNGLVQPMGYLQNATLPTIKPGNTIFADVWLSQPTTSAGGGSVNIRIEIANEAIAVPVGPGVTAVGRGILSGVFEPENILLSGKLVTPTGTPDAVVHLSAGSYLLSGNQYTDGALTATLNQNDGAAAALVAGEEYQAIIVQDVNALVVTKGAKAVAGSSVAPTAAPGIFLALVRVSYHAGASVITSGDITLNTPTYGRYLVVEAATGLTAKVHTGRALIANFMQQRALPGDVTLVNSATNRIWLEYTGVVTVTQTAALPSAGALLLATLVTSGGNVTSNTDNRTYVGQAGVLSLHAVTHATGGTDPITPASISAAPIAAPAFTGATPTIATDPGPGDSSTKVPSTGWVQTELAGVTATTLGTATERQLLYTADGTHDPGAMSPVPKTGTKPSVYKNGLKMREGSGLDYTRSGTNLEQVNFTSIPPAPDLIEINWWG